MRFVSFSSHFLFFILVDKVTKNENSLRDFCTMFFVCKARQARRKWKIIKNKNRLLCDISVFRNFCQPKRKNKKWDEKLIELVLGWPAVLKFFENLQSIRFWGWVSVHYRVCTKKLDNIKTRKLHFFLKDVLFEVEID